MTLPMAIVKSSSESDIPTSVSHLSLARNTLVPTLYILYVSLFIDQSVDISYIKRLSLSLHSEYWSQAVEIVVQEIRHMTYKWMPHVDPWNCT